MIRTAAEKLGLVPGDELVRYVTARDNLLLRSARGSRLRQVLTLTMAGRVASEPGLNTYAAFTSEGRWGYDYTRDVQILARAGMVKVDGNGRVGITEKGDRSLRGAMLALGEEIDLAELLDEIDRVDRIYTGQAA